MDQSINQRIKELIKRTAEGKVDRFAKMIGVSGTTITHIVGDRKSKPHYETQRKVLEKDFEIDGQMKHVNPTWWLFGYGDIFISASQSNNGTNLITVDNQGEENIVLVDTKAAASYPSAFMEPEYFGDKPTFNLPGSRFQQGTHRAFEIKGDSMIPRFNNGDIVIAELMHDWVTDIKNYFAYIVVLGEDVLCKRIVNRIKDRERLRLISDNPTIDAWEEPAENILQIWRIKANITFDLNPYFDMQTWMQTLENQVHDLREEVRKLRE